MPRCQGPVASSVEVRMRPTHLTFRTPTTPGTITRTGAPCSSGNGSPFISKASSTSPYGLKAFSMGMLACIVSSPSKTTCLMPFHSTASKLNPAQCMRTSRKATPPQRAVDIAPMPQGMPEVFSTLSSSLRRLPPHWIVVTTSRFRKRDFRSSRLRSTDLVPSPSTNKRYLPASVTGTGWWWRMNQTGLGVSQASIIISGGSSALQGLLLWKIRPGCLSGSRS
mmetsp:Transcript_5527/g.14708  ORF Transcript_5527/g.14708 Transcript_5527/m.14708 type:complete len:223 (-) Transcript_5527:660-1328(-)